MDMLSWFQQQWRGSKYSYRIWDLFLDHLPTEMSTIEELPCCRYENAQKLVVKNHNILKQAGQIFSIELSLVSFRLMLLARWAEI